jgi:tetratricopeptide (TPR) repeat protein
MNVRIRSDWATHFSAFCLGLVGLSLAITLGCAPAAEPRVEQNTRPCSRLLTRDCTLRASSHWKLPSEFGPPQKITGSRPLSVEGNEAVALFHKGKFSDALPALLRVARGEHGEDKYTRQMFDGRVAYALYQLKDYGGALDLARLMVANAEHHARDQGVDLVRWLALTGRCATPSQLVMLTNLELFLGNDPKPQLLLLAQGYLEAGRLAEARSRFEQLLPEVPEYAGECVNYIDSLAPGSGLPAPCDCGLFGLRLDGTPFGPPRDPSGSCACEAFLRGWPTSPLGENEEWQCDNAGEHCRKTVRHIDLPPPGECLCDPSGIRCERRVARVDRQDAKGFVWTSELCMQEATP